MTTNRTVTVDLEPIYWRGSPILTWMAAGVAWFGVGFLVLTIIVGATHV